MVGYLVNSMIKQNTAINLKTASADAKIKIQGHIKEISWWYASVTLRFSGRADSFNIRLRHFLKTLKMYFSGMGRNMTIVRI